MLLSKWRIEPTWNNSSKRNTHTDIHTPEPTQYLFTDYRHYDPHTWYPHIDTIWSYSSPNFDEFLWKRQKVRPQAL